MIEIGMITVSPFEILYIRHSLALSPSSQPTSYSLNLVVEDPIAAYERLREWDDVGLCGRSDGAVHSRVQPERFADNGVEVVEGVEIVHRRRVVRERPEFLAQFSLDLGLAGEREESPCRRG